MVKFLKNNTLFIALFIGIILFEPLSKLSFTTPYILFSMLFLTFSKINIKDLRFEKIHFILLTFQLVSAITIFYFLSPYNPIVAQGAFVCFLCPTAISAAVVTVKMGGRIESISTYTMLSNLTIAILIPFLLPLITETSNTDTFATLFTQIIKKVFPLLLCPFIIAQAIKLLTPKINTKITSYSGLSFYLWAIALTIVTAQTIKSLIESETLGNTIIWLALVSLIACTINFALGRYLGRKTGHPIAATQSLGQKNTILAIWMSHTFLNPLTALAPGCYVLWQNLFNAFQISHHTKKLNNK